MSTYGNPLFMGLQKSEKENPWVSIAASYIVQAIMVIALLAYTVIAPRIETPAVKYVDLVAPDLKPAPAAPTKPVRPVAKVEPDRFVMPVVVPKIEPPLLQVHQPQRIHTVAVVAEVPRPQLNVAAPKFDSKVLNALPGPKSVSKIIATNTFGGSSATPTLQKIAPSKVQTGGFGDPNGVPLNAHGSNKSNIATVGSFDLPAGGGYGNGVAVQGGGGRGGGAGQGRVQTANFVNATAAPPADSARQMKAVDRPASTTPVSIQSKPTPVYTSEARQLKIEGEVLLNVVFTADGQIRILKVVRGLGHGLDEAAERAAQGIKFSPAMRDGHPVDSNATLHIVFQLS
jgi:TonB family protein